MSFFTYPLLIDKFEKMINGFQFFSFFRTHLHLTPFIDIIDKIYFLLLLIHMNFLK